MMNNNSENEIRLSFKVDLMKNSRAGLMFLFFLLGFTFCCAVLIFGNLDSGVGYLGLACLSFVWVIPAILILGFSQDFRIRRGEILREIHVFGVCFSKRFFGKAVFLKELCVHSKAQTGANPLYFYDFRVSEDADCEVLSEKDDLFENSQIFLSNASRIFLQVPKNTILRIAKVFEEPEIYVQGRHFRTDNPQGVFNEKFRLEP